MRAYVCPQCDHVLCVGSDGLVATAMAHAAADGSVHAGQALVELPGHDHVAGVAWHVEHARATGADLRAAFPPRPIPPTMALGRNDTIVPSN